MRRSTRRAISLSLMGWVFFCAGCDSEDKLTGTPTNLPPNTMPPAPPLTQTPADLAKSKGGEEGPGQGPESPEAGGHVTVPAATALAGKVRDGGSARARSSVSRGGRRVFPLP